MIEDETPLYHGVQGDDGISDRLLPNDEETTTVHALRKPYFHYSPDFCGIECNSGGM